MTEEEEYKKSRKDDGSCLRGSAKSRKMGCGVNSNDDLGTGWNALALGRASTVWPDNGLEQRSAVVEEGQDIHKVEDKRFWEICLARGYP
ncbi:hypothetical protein QJS04_geneDACA021116 [Acorus gramineus]|uniref:Uncharacterized protein n=1 Tax=Acorus gramineus TaxID=55184 RepID=A0AAV9BQG4_ACOGR|nr:hypothetical protein QJS04_geneDACA021116 [Acorus gramineus]